jgi:hypothetical protein
MSFGRLSRIWFCDDDSGSTERRTVQHWVTGVFAMIAMRRNPASSRLVDELERGHDEDEIESALDDDFRRGQMEFSIMGGYEVSRQRCCTGKIEDRRSCEKVVVMIREHVCANLG